MLVFVCCCSVVLWGGVKFLFEFCGGFLFVFLCAGVLLLFFLVCMRVMFLFLGEFLFFGFGVLGFLI